MSYWLETVNGCEASFKVKGAFAEWNSRARNEGTNMKPKLSALIQTKEWNFATELGKSHLDLNARWIHDFDVSEPVEGDGFNLIASLKF